MSQSYLESFLEDYRLVSLFTVICVLILRHYLKIVSNVLYKTYHGMTKHVLVTGCDTGFGYEIALDLSREKCRVFAGCLTEEGVRRLEEDKIFEGVAFIMDVTKDEDVGRAKELIGEELKDIANGIYKERYSGFRTLSEPPENTPGYIALSGKCH